MLFFSQDFQDQILFSSIIKIMQIKVCKVRLAVLFLSLVRYKAEAKQLVIFFNFKKSHTTQVKNKMCKTKSQIRQEAFIYC